VAEAKDEVGAGERCFCGASRGFEAVRIEVEGEEQLVGREERVRRRREGRRRGKRGCQRVYEVLELYDGSALVC
jgi:hypothetical protein